MKKILLIIFFVSAVNLHSQNNINLHFGINSSSTNQNELNRGLSLGPLVKAGWNIYFLHETGIQLNSGFSWNRNNYNGLEAAILVFYDLEEKIQILGGVNFHKNIVIEFSGGMWGSYKNFSTIMVNLAANYNFYRAVKVQLDLELPVKNTFREIKDRIEGTAHSSKINFVVGVKLVFVL
ncbi:MAG: hypothetical protein K8F36_09960 [Melioribacteraceae bacterium]|nr:hypothetical protein [Melioribacteraceae bacterium]